MNDATSVLETPSHEDGIEEIRATLDGLLTALALACETLAATADRLRAGR